MVAIQGHPHTWEFTTGTRRSFEEAFIPAALRPQVLETIHAAHHGVSGMISQIEETDF